MPKIKIPEMEVNTEDFGFPPSATPSAEDVVERIKGLQEQKVFWETKAKDVQAFAARQKETEKKLKEMECELLIDGAVRDFKISKAQAQFYRDMYLVNPMRVKEHIEALSAQQYLKDEIGLSGANAGPIDASVELSVRVAEIMANNTTLEQAQAVQQALKDRGLYERVTKQRQAASSANGGAK